MTFLTRSEFAKSKNWSRQYVGKLAQQGRLIYAADGLVDVDATEQYLAMTADPARRGAGESLSADVTTQAAQPVVSHSQPTGASGYQHAKTRLALAQAETAETSLRVTNGLLVDVSVVDEAAFSAGRMLRDLILSLPAQLAPELSIISDPWQIERHLAAALRRVLDDAASMTAADFNHAIHSTS